MITTHTTPPSGLLNETQLPINDLSTLVSLPNELLVLIHRKQAINDLNENNGERGTKAPAELCAEDAVEAHDGEVPYEGLEDLVGDDGAVEGNDEEEALGDGADEAAGAVEDAAVAWLVVLDGVAERVEDGDPGDDEHEAAGFEAGGGGGGDCVLFRHFGVALVGDEFPASGNDEEEVLTC